MIISAYIDISVTGIQNTTNFQKMQQLTSPAKLKIEMPLSLNSGHNQSVLEMIYQYWNYCKKEYLLKCDKIVLTLIIYGYDVS